MTSPLPPMPKPLKKALADKGYDSLTPVQTAVLAPELAGRDLLVSAQTGSGKTVAFGLAMAEQLLDGAERMPPPDTPRVLVIAPTRELALQVRREFEWLYGPAGAVITSCVGGMDARTERRALERGAHIVVGTPGRLRDHIERSNIDLSTLAAVTLDEADEMLDLGFREDLEFILSAAPESRRTLLFSATVSKPIEKLARTYQRDAERVATVAQRESHADIAYRALVVSPEDAENAIVNVLRYYEARNALVFCKTRAAVNHLTARFLNRGFPVVPLSGELAQEERARALQAMRDGRARVCVATDVAARGIDLPGLDLVVHADLPSNRETLLHRSGRTGRAGKKGVSCLIVPFSARRRTERLLGSAGVEADWGTAPTVAEVNERDTERLLTDEAMTAPETEAETAMVDMLSEKFSARELATGLARLYFASKSAPEDVAQVSVDGPKPRARAEFERSFWMRLSTGHNERAEPRWLLPMLCRAGNLTKTDIGAIRIFDDHTLVQLHDDCRDRFTAALGPDMSLEQGISVTPAQAPTQSERPARPPRREGKGGAGHRGKRPRREDGDDKPYAKRPRDDDRPAPRKTDRKPADHAKGDRPKREPREDGPRDARPYGKGANGPRHDRKSFDDKPRAKGKPAAKYGAKPAEKPARKSADKPAPKPAGKAGGKPASARPKFDASNPSARLRPGKPTRGKPGAKGPRGPAKGPNARPTRPKS